MSATIATPAVLGNPQNLRIVKVKVTLDDSYPTGGYDLSSAIQADGVKNLGNAVFGIATGRYTTGGPFVYVFNPATNKLAAFCSNGAAPARFVEVTAATDVSAQVVDVLLFFVDSVGASA